MPCEVHVKALYDDKKLDVLTYTSVASCRFIQRFGVNYNSQNNLFWFLK